VAASNEHVEWKAKRRPLDPNHPVDNKPMRYIGRWIDSLKDIEYPPPHELVGEYDTTAKRKVVDYLNSGHVLWVYRGFASCLFQCGYSEPYTERTDGKWVWPCDLAHYVDAHSVLVPPDFIADAVASTVLPEFDDQWRSEGSDFAYWRAWCIENASGCLRNRIASALENANQDAEHALNARADEMEREHGRASVRCIWAGCTNTALAGRVLCARCCLKGSEDTYVWHFYDVSTVING
jgi:hypothetical protein